MNFGLKNVGNTATPYTLDFAIADTNVLALIENRQIATQVIAWQNKQVDDVTLCVPRLLTENRVIAAVNDPDLSQLEIPTVDDNRTPTLTYFVTPGDILQITLRFIGPLESMQSVVAPALEEDIISYVFASQAANTYENDLGIGREQIINDRTPPTLHFLTGDSRILEANVRNGAILPEDYITAEKDGVPILVNCTPALGSIVQLDILNDDQGGTELSCETVPLENGVTAKYIDTLHVYDTEAPIIDPTTMPLDQLVEAESSAGTQVIYDPPMANDVWGVDDSVDVSCTPASGSTFPLAAPGPLTTVTCIATDESGNPSAPETFSVAVQDTTPPVIDDDFDFEPPTTPYNLSADSSTFLLTWGPFGVIDADSAPLVECTPGTRDDNVQPPLYKFFHDFPVGTTTVICTATDDNGLIASISFPVAVFDDIPPVITLNGDSTITLDAGSGPYTDPGATAIDNSDPDVPVTIIDDANAVDTTTAGTYTVTYTATDPSGNSSTATRTVIVEFTYGMTGIIPTKTNVQMGSSNPLYWAWLDANGNPVDTSGDTQMLRIENCDTGAIIESPASDTGSSDFRLKEDNWWQFNWDADVPEGAVYCAYVTNSRTPQQEMGSPRIRVR